MHNKAILLDTISHFLLTTDTKKLFRVFVQLFSKYLPLCVEVLVGLPLHPPLQCLLAFFGQLCIALQLYVEVMVGLLRNLCHLLLSSLLVVSLLLCTNLQLYVVRVFLLLCASLHLFVEVLVGLPLYFFS